MVEPGGEGGQQTTVSSYQSHQPATTQRFLIAKSTKKPSYRRFINVVVTNCSVLDNRLVQDTRHKSRDTRLLPDTAIQ